MLVQVLDHRCVSAVLDKMKKERSYGSDKEIGRSITIPVLPLEKIEAQRGSETCQVSRKISNRVSPECQQSVLSSAQGGGQVGGNLLDDFQGFRSSKDIMSTQSIKCGRTNQPGHIIL